MILRMMIVMVMVLIQIKVLPRAEPRVRGRLTRVMLLVEVVELVQSQPAREAAELPPDAGLPTAKKDSRLLSHHHSSLLQHHCPGGAAWRVEPRVAPTLPHGAPDPTMQPGADQRQPMILERPMSNLECLWMTQAVTVEPLR